MINTEKTSSDHALKIRKINSVYANFKVHMHAFPHVVILYLDVLAPQSRSTIYRQHFCNISSGRAVIIHHWNEPCPSKESVVFVLNCQGQKFHVDDYVIDLDHHNYRLASIFQVKYNRETFLALAMLNFAHFHVALYDSDSIINNEGIFKL